MDNRLCKKYFAASNSAEGFVNYFPQIFNSDTCSRIFVIKGGPGTGKSRFMRDVANEAERKGLGVVYYYCSSDSDSLDGIIIEEMGVGILDGTAPHTFEPKTVGAFEQIINLGEFWNERELAERKSEISHIGLKKSAAYDRAYMLLRSYDALLRAEESLISPFVNYKKLGGAVKRLLHKLPASEKPVTDIALCRSIGMNGKTKFDTYEKNAKQVFTVSDYYHIGGIVLGEIVKTAKEMSMSLKISYDPIMREKIDAVELCDAGIVFVIGEGVERRINAKRFIEDENIREIKEKFKSFESQANNIEELILSEFEEIKAYHFALEAIYCEAMDFSLKEEYTDRFIKKLFK